jgi:hypothetical protein
MATPTADQKPTAPAPPVAAATPPPAVLGDDAVAAHVPAAAPQASDAATPTPTDRRPWPRRAARFAGRHALVTVAALVALAARGFVVAAYRPALMYLGDSGAYLDQAWHGFWPGDWRPAGYPMFLRLVDGEEHLTRLVVLQQSLTFALGLALYAVTVRLTRRTWLATLCALPIWLCPWVLDLGQFVLAESLFSVLTGLGLLLLALPGRPRLWAAAVAGLLLGVSLPVRTVGFGPLAVGFAGLLLASVRARRADTTTGRPHGTARALGLVLAFAAAGAAPICAYAGWNAANGKGFTVSAHSGYFLYGRVAPYADCSLLPKDRPELLTLCDSRPVARRSQPDSYLWPAASPLRQGHIHIPAGREQLAGQFATDVVHAQPWMLMTTTADYVAGYFSPTRHETLKTSRAYTWELPDQSTDVLTNDRDPHAADGYYVATSVDRSIASRLAAYSRLQYAPMPLVAAGLLAGLLAAPIARLRRRAGPPRLFWLAAGGGMSVLVVSALTSGFDYRYLASVIGLLGAAAILGAASLARALRRG